MNRTTTPTTVLFETLDLGANGAWIHKSFINKGKEMVVVPLDRDWHRDGLRQSADAQGQPFTVACGVGCGRQRSSDAGTSAIVAPAEVAPRPEMRRSEHPQSASAHTSPTIGGTYASLKVISADVYGGANGSMYADLNGPDGIYVYRCGVETFAHSQFGQCLRFNEQFVSPDHPAMAEMQAFSAELKMVGISEHAAFAPLKFCKAAPCSVVSRLHGSLPSRTRTWLEPR